MNAQTALIVLADIAAKAPIVSAELARWDDDSALPEKAPEKPAPAELARWSE